MSSATDDPEAAAAPPLDQSSAASQQLLLATQVAGTPSETEDDVGVDDGDDEDDVYRQHGENAVVKLEDAIDDSEQQYDTSTSTTLRPAPQPSAKRRESEAAADASVTEVSDRPAKKRKRHQSPPWQFGSVAHATLKSGDGRRTSARFNASNPATPAHSESEGAALGPTRHRSTSQSLAGRSRGPSPPWKKFEAPGPTARFVDGKRVSGRVNKDPEEQSQPKPKRVSPRGKKVAVQVEEERRGSGRPPSKDKDTKPSSRPSSRGDIMRTDGAADVRPRKKPKGARAPSPQTLVRQLKAQIAALERKRGQSSPPPEQSPPRKHRRVRSKGTADQPTHFDACSSSMRPNGVPSTSPTANGRAPRLRLHARRPKVTEAPHPQAITAPPARPPKLSFHQVIEPFELREMQQPYMETDRGPPGREYFKSRNEKQALDEAQMRKRLVEAALPGGALSPAVCSIYHDDPQEELPPQYGRSDHLVAQALHLRHLQIREKNHHRALAKKVANEALEYWKALRGPTEEDIRAEQDKIFKLIHKQVVTDIRAKWDMVHAHVQQLRKERWEAEEDARRQERLQERLEQAEAMIARQRGEDSEGEDSMGDAEGDDEGVSGSEDQSEAENMSESDDGTAEDDEGEGGEYDDLEAYKKQRMLEQMLEEAEREKKRLAEFQEAGSDDDANGDQEREDDTDEDSDPSTADTATAATATSLPAVALDPGRVEIATSGVDQFQGTADDDKVPPSPAAEDGTAALLDSGAFDDDDEEDEEEFEPDADDEGDEDMDDEDDDDPNDGPNATKDEGAVTVAAGISTRAFADDNVEMADADLDDDESVDMDDSDDRMSTDDDAQDDDESHEEDSDVAQTSTMAMLFGPKRIKELGLPTPNPSADGEGREPTPNVAVGEDLDAQAGATETVEPTDRIESDHQQGPPAEASTPPFDDGIAQDSATGSPIPEATSKQLIPVPTLLRGTLRSYQHAGLDWLASLHRNSINGILADEMGLGKTIQTIALLAHLAESQGIWEPHLIIVPTSVILNWVNEFHKFLPGFRVLGYYGSQEERTAKRKGWVNDPHHENKEKRGYNVVVTSYNVALADINAIRNVQWHYLVLDEAHNIRNFMSQRFQALIRLKTRARLLLTGTPLQNSLTELWSLLTFLTAGDDDPAHGDLEEFLSHWKEPVKEIFDRGVSSLSAEAQRVVDQLHVSLRPFLLRRLKTEVEKDLPKKTESVVVCKLSKRQRQLYQEYMGLASTRESLTKGNAVSAGRVLLSLRRVCNHPDLFDPRPIQTSYALEISPVEPYAVKESIVRRLLGVQDEVAQGLILAGREGHRRGMLKRSKQLDASVLLKKQVVDLEKEYVQADPGSLAGALALQRVRRRNQQLVRLRNSITCTSNALAATPVYGTDLVELLNVKTGKPYTVTYRLRQPQGTYTVMRTMPKLGPRPLRLEHKSDWLITQDTAWNRDVLTFDRIAEHLHDTITRFAFCTPVATAPVLDLTIAPKQQRLLRDSPAYPRDFDFAHEARSRTSIVFPDSRLLIYDSGKLQRLTSLLRDLQSRGSRSLIFTQMTGTLNILEQFLNLLGLPYLRLDGSTPPERRMLYSSEFNRPDSKYQVMILSSRAGGVGLNLTGASSVIFYDLDWNPQMDRQCMDRAHRIGQVRDVEVYKMVSEKTVEENILRRANQKSLLDQTVIQEGNFTTEHLQQSAKRVEEVADGEEDGDGVAAAIERFLGGGEKNANAAIASVEDREDVLAAEAARKEENQDAAEFSEQASSKPGRSAAATPGPGVAVEEEDGEKDRKGHVDAWMVEWMEEQLRDVKYVPPPSGRPGRDPGHRARKGRKR